MKRSNKIELKFIKHIIMIITFISCFVSLIGCQKFQEKKGSIYVFSTFIDITLYDTNKNKLEEVYKEVTRIYQEYNYLCDSYTNNPNVNNVYKINHSSNFVSVDQKLKDVILFSFLMKEETNGYFDVLIGNITSSYKKLIKSEEISDDLIPTKEYLETELENTKKTTVSFNELEIKREGMASIDLGAVAKGYASKIVKEYLKEQKIDHYLINAGSSTIICGEKVTSMWEKDSRYKVGIKTISNKTLLIKNKGFGTSSLFEQYVVYKDKTYHHIINPKTGYPETLYDIICVVGNDPAIIDALTTAYMSMPISEIKDNLNKINASGDKYDVLIYKDNVLLLEIKEGNNYE